MILMASLDWDVAYGFEYVGPSARLVPTPETERAFVALAQALKEHQGVALGGEKESGKRQLLLELAATAAAWI